MAGSKTHLVVDILAYIAMIVLAATGILMFCRLPPGSGSLTVLGYTRHQWGTVHFYTAASLLSLVALHIILHWHWVTNTFGALTRPRGERKAGAGPLGAALLLAIGLASAGVIAAPWLFSVTPGGGGEGHGEGKGKGRRGGKAAAAPDTSDVAAASTKEGHGEGAEHGSGGIRGSMTVTEAAAAAGVPVARLLAELKLPDSTSPTETLGRLRQRHPFSMQDVRSAMARLKKDDPKNP